MVVKPTEKSDAAPAPTPNPTPMDGLSFEFVPPTIFGRTKQHDALLRALQGAAYAQQGGCALYLSGLPGSGKTALVQHLVGPHPAPPNNTAVQELRDCTRLIWLNCMHLLGTSDMYDKLAYATGVKSAEESSSSGTKCVPTGDALVQQLRAKFLAPPRRCQGKKAARLWVVVCDEVEALLGRTPDGSGRLQQHLQRRVAFDSLLSWALEPRSRLALISISNDMTLKSALLVGHRNKVVPVHFPSYQRADLVGLVRGRMGKYADLFAPRALEYLASKVASENGDARRMLEFCRRSLALVLSDQAPPLKKPRRSTAATTPKAARVDLAVVEVAAHEGSPPPLSPDTPPPDSKAQPHPSARTVNLHEAACIFSTPLALLQLPEKQKHLLASGTLLAQTTTGAPTLSSWLTFHKNVCKEKLLPPVLHAEIDDMLSGLEQQKLVSLRGAGPHASRHSTRVVLRVSAEDLRHSFADEPIMIDLLSSDCSSFLPK